MKEVLFKYPDACLDGYDNSFSVNKWLFQKQNILSTLDVEFPAEHTKVNCSNVIQAGCKAYNINQRFVLMTLQREQQLVELGGLPRKTVPDDNTMKRATGCGCFDDGTTVSKFSGFYNQIYCACSTYRFWFKSYHQDVVAELVAPDVEKAVICKSAVTYALIKYTPHVGALELSEKIWSRYFEGNNG